MRTPVPGTAATAAAALPAASAGNGRVPTLAELVALRGTARRPTVARVGRHGVSGPAASNVRGRGMEYAESREYVAGDDARHIDWRLTARSGRTHTKLFQAERERLTLIVADTAPALYFGTRVRFKSVQAARVGAVAAWRAARDGDRIAALRGSDREAPVAPASGTRGALRVLDALARWYAAVPDDDTGLEAALARAARLLRPGSRLVVLADAASLAAVPDVRWPALAMHHEVRVVVLADVIERAPPRALLPFATARGEGHRVDLDLADSGARARWRDAFATPADRVIARLRTRGVHAGLLMADAPSDAWLPSGAPPPRPTAA